MLPESLASSKYEWPQQKLDAETKWQPLNGQPLRFRQMPESMEELAEDSRWPAFFPCPVSIVTTTDGESVGLEKVVGASIVNRFPYVIALSFCTVPLSKRHYVRRTFTDLLEKTGECAIQFLPPGRELDRTMEAITKIPEDDMPARMRHAGMKTRPADTNRAPVFENAYMVYEARLVKPGKDFEGQPIYDKAWIDVGSHRVYFLEINAIQLREDVAEGRSQIAWRALPAWEPKLATAKATPVGGGDHGEKYRKGYAPNYRFPSAATAAFEADCAKNGMKIKYLPPLPEDQVEVDNDRARWPCFFPSALGMITTWADKGVPNLMPCGSTTILSRHPLVFAIAVSYAAINARYAPRESLNILRKTKRFGCGVPYINDDIVDAIRTAGNTSFKEDPHKVANAGLHVYPSEWAPVLDALPVHFDCEVIGEVRLGTHILFLGEVKRILVRSDVTPENPLEWCPWATVIPLNEHKNGHK